MAVFVSRAHKKTVPIIVVRTSPRSRRSLPRMAKAWLESTGFSFQAGRSALIPTAKGELAAVVVVAATPLSAWDLAGLPRRLPKGRYAIETELEPDEATAVCLGWGLGSYAYDTYKSKKAAGGRQLVWPEGADRREAQRLIEGTTLGRDLINAPAEDLGPADIARAVRSLGRRFDAQVRVISGAKLEQGFPAIYAVGKGAAKDRQPRLCDLRWGKAKNPRVTLVGKGVVFDSGGLDIKSAAGMRLMKKDMGGAASVLGLASMIMDAKLPIRLRVLVPTVENAVSAEAYRPGDVLRTRHGQTIEVGNTDAEGRLILCDALTLADEESPELIIDFATLTGAARVALGTELPALFSRRDVDAGTTMAAIAASKHDPDPMWHMPLHMPYRRHLDSYIADIHNIDNVGKGGAITAALFLSTFIDSKRPWIHVDTMGWNTSSRPGRPKGGELFGVRAMYRMLSSRYG